MDTNRLDYVAKLFASRSSRRAALAGSGLGLAAAAFGAARLAGAQEATPAATPGNATDSGGQAGNTYPEFLFTQAFESGSWAPKSGEEGTYVLTLSGIATQTNYFSDRPDRIFGLVPNEQFLDALGFTPNNPPNAALVAEAASGEEEAVLIVELTNAVYDAGTQTLTYEARVLADYNEPELAHAAVRQGDAAIAAQFGRGGLFIDDCSDAEMICQTIPSDGGVVIGSIGDQGQCWHWVNPTGCEPCSDYAGTCAQKYPRQCEQQVTDANGQVTVYYMCVAYEA